MRGKFVLPLFREPQPAARKPETLANQLRHGPGGVHAGPEVGIVVALAAHATHDGHDVCSAIGKVFRQPFSEKIFHFVRKS